MSALKTTDISPRILAVAGSQKGLELSDELLSRELAGDISRAASAGEARRLLMGGGFDLCVVNSPLSDEVGDALCADACSSSACEAILLVKAELFEETDYRAGAFGVLTVSKPVQRTAFHTAFRLASAANRRARLLEAENVKLLQQLDELKIVSRAKCSLIEREGMSEQDAHRYIEKRAMDARLPRRAAAEEILLKYR